MLVKLRGGLVLGVDDNRKDRRVGPRGAKGGIRDERAAEPLPFVRSRNGKSSDQAGRQQGIARKALRLLGRKLADRKARSGEGVIAGDLAALPYGNKAVAEPALCVLGGQLAQIPVERFDATGEAFAVVLGAKRLNGDRNCHRMSFTTSRCAAAARRMASLGAGGSRIAATNAR